MVQVLGRWIVLMVGVLALSACATGRDLDKPPVPLGDFMLGHSIVVAPNLTKGPLSRDATKEEWIAAVDKAFEDRFRRYEGEKLYHFGISVEGYVLAQVGIPLVLQPKSAVIYRITVWDDAAGGKINEEPKEITIVEALTPESVAGSGLTQTREEQLENLAVQAAKQAEQWLVGQVKNEGWFGGSVAGLQGADTEESVTELAAVDADAAVSESVEDTGTEDESAAETSEAEPAEAEGASADTGEAEGAEDAAESTAPEEGAEGAAEGETKKKSLWQLLVQEPEEAVSDPVVALPEEDIVPPAN